MSLAPNSNTAFLEKPSSGFRIFYLVWVSLGLASSVIGVILTAVGIYFISISPSTPETEALKLSNTETLVLVLSVLINIIIAITMIVYINKINGDIRSENRVESLNRYNIINIIYSFLPLLVSLINVLLSGFADDVERYVTYFSVFISAGITAGVFIFSLRDIESIKKYNLQFDEQSVESDDSVDK